MTIALAAIVWTYSIFRFFSSAFDGEAAFGWLIAVIASGVVLGSVL